VSVTLGGLHSTFATAATVFDNELEALMLAQEADTEILPRLPGVLQDPTPVSWISSMNPLGGSFSYATASSATYANMALSLRASGTFEA
jgi:hypothetical protein